jgi:hypothetical protein
MNRSVFAVLAVGLLGCAAAAGRGQPSHPSRCAPGDQPLIRDMLYFGRNKPAGGQVSDAEWESFLSGFVTPRFPSGLTVVHAVGQWRGSSGAVEREQTAIVSLLHSGDSAAQVAVAAVAAEYKSRFGQEAVLRERILTCSAF